MPPERGAPINRLFLWGISRRKHNTQHNATHISEEERLRPKKRAEWKTRERLN